MAILRSDVEAALYKEDIENLLKLGAPSGEYSSEAQDIIAAIMKLPAGKMNEATIVAIIALVWQKYFDLSAADIEKRMPAFHAVAHKLLA